MILAGLLLLNDHARATLAPGALRLEGGRIAAVALGDDALALGRPDLGGPSHVICPGFVDAHLHLPQFDRVGVDGLTLLEWLEAAVFPAEARWADADFAGQMAARVARRLLSVGTTAVAAYATVHHAGTKAAMHALDQAGLRGHVGQVLMDRRAPSELLRPAHEQLADAATLAPVGRIAPAVTPRFAVSCSGELLAGAGRLAQTTGWTVQTHLSETLDECALVGELFGGLEYTEVYRRAGLLTPRTLLGHGIHLSPGELAAIKGAGASIAHCPTANLFLQAGAMDLAERRRTGVHVAIGSDIAGGPDASMVRVARGVIETAKRTRDPGDALPSAAEVFFAITAGNAERLGLADAGRLAPGAAGDLIVVDPSRTPGLSLDFSDHPDPLAALLYQWDDRWITHTLCAGRVVYG